MPRDSLVDQFFNEVRAELARGGQKDPVLSLLPLGFRIAGKYHRPGLEYADLIAEAALAVVVAVRGYERSKAKANGVPLPIYVSNCVHAKLRDAVRRAIPVHLGKETWRDMSRCLEARDQHDSEDAIAAAIGMPVSKVRRLLELAHGLKRIDSLDHPAGGASDDDRLLAETIQDDEADVEERVISKLERDRVRAEVRELVNGLPAMSRLAISLRFGVEVPACSVVPMEDVLRASIAHNAGAGMDRLRRRVLNGEGGAVVQKGRDRFVHIAYSPCRPGSKARVRRDQVAWRRVASEPPPKALVAS